MVGEKSLRCLFEGMGKSNMQKVFSQQAMFPPFPALGNWPQPRLFAAVASLVLVLLGTVLLGQGLYIFAKAQVAQLLLQKAFAETLRTGKIVKPWSWADMWPVARVEVPRLGENQIVLSGASGQSLAFGPGHLNNTPEPGMSGTAVYAAHRDTHFHFLKDIKIGDHIYVTNASGKRLLFFVQKAKVVHWNNNGIDVSAAGKNLVLSTCWPFNSKTPGPMRYVVYAAQKKE